MLAQLGCGTVVRRCSGLALVVVLFAGCGGSPAPPTQPSTSTGTLSQVAKAYLDEIISTMQTYSLYRHNIDWTAFRTSVYTAAGSAQAVSDTYPAIRVAYGLLGDIHGRYTSPSGTSVSGGTSLNCSDSSPASATLPAGIQLVKVPQCVYLPSTPEAVQFAQQIQDAIRTGDADATVGWIVDLRNNLGGDTYPMIAGIGPILGEGIWGYFTGPDGKNDAYGYRAGSSFWSNDVETTVTNPYSLRQPNPKVAVLLNTVTASAGESVAIGSVGRPNTRSFGNPTCGYTTGVSTYSLSDGAKVGLATSVMADRTGHTYGRQVVPDETIADSAATLQLAIEWLQGK